MTHAELHPDDLRTRLEHERLVDDSWRILRSAEHVDHVYRFRNIGQPGIDLLRENRLAGLTGIDRDHAVSALEQILEGKIAGPVILWRDADHGNRLHGVEDPADITVRVAVVGHE